MKQNKLIKNALNIKGKFKYMLVLFSSITILLLFLLRIIFSGMTVEVVQEGIEQYGDYGYFVKDTSDKVYKDIQNMGNTKQVHYVSYEEKIVETKKMDYDYNLYYDKTERLELYGAKLIKGHFPEKGEALVDLEYLKFKGMQPTDIGKEITIDANNETYKIAGVLSKTSLFIGEEDSEFIIIMNDGECKPNCLFVALKDYSSLPITVSYCKKYILENTVANLGLKNYLGFSMGESIFQSMEKQYRNVNAGAFACIGILFFLIIKLVIIKSYKGLTILNLLGVGKEKSIKILFLETVKYCSVGVGIGVAGAIGFAHIMYMILYGNTELAHLAIKQVSLWDVIRDFGIGVIILCVYSVVLIVQLVKLSPTEILKTHKSLFRKKEAKRSNIFYRKHNWFLWRKLANNQLRDIKFYHFISVVCIVVSLSAIVIGIFRMEIDLTMDVPNQEMNYSIAIDDMLLEEKDIENIKKQYEQNFDFSDDVKLLGIYEKEVEAKVKIKQLDEDYVDYINKKYCDSLVELLLETKKKTINVDVLAYSKPAFELLAKENDISNFTLKDGEAIVLDHIYSNDSKDGNFLHNFVVGDEISFREDEDSPKVKVKIAKSVSDLPVYPLYGDDDLIIIVPEQTYQKLFDEILPLNIYVKNSVTTKANLDALTYLEKSSDYTVKHPKSSHEEKLELLKHYIQLYVLLFVIISVIALFIVLLAFLVQHYQTEEELNLLYVIGINKSLLRKTVAYKIIRIFMEAIVISGGVVFGATKWIYTNMYEISGDYLYRFPWEYFVMGCSIVLLEMLAISILMVKKVDCKSAVSITCSV